MVIRQRRLQAWLPVEGIQAGAWRQAWAALSNWVGLQPGDALLAVAIEVGVAVDARVMVPTQYVLPAWHVVHSKASFYVYQL